jgi:hypothetical protein
VRVGEPHHEPRAVQVRVDLELEVDLRPFGDEAERVVEPRAVAHHRPEHHLVVAALGPADAAGHPRVDEDGDPLVVPARRRDARRGQVHVEDRLGLLGHGVHLARRRTGGTGDPSGRLIHRRHVDQLVVHDRVQALVGGDRLEGEAERGDLHHHHVAGHDRDAGVAVVLEVGEQHRDVGVGS